MNELSLPRETVGTLSTLIGQPIREVHCDGFELVARFDAGHLVCTPADRIADSQNDFDELIWTEISFPESGGRPGTRLIAPGDGAVLEDILIARTMLFFSDYETYGPVYRTAWGVRTFWAALIALISPSKRSRAKAVVTAAMSQAIGGNEGFLCNPADVDTWSRVDEAYVTKVDAGIVLDLGGDRYIPVFSNWNAFSFPIDRAENAIRNWSRLREEFDDGYEFQRIGRSVDR